MVYEINGIIACRRRHLDRSLLLLAPSRAITSSIATVASRGHVTPVGVAVVRQESPHDGRVARPPLAAAQPGVDQTAQSDRLHVRPTAGVRGGLHRATHGRHRHALSPPGGVRRRTGGGGRRRRLHLHAETLITGKTPITVR